MENYIARYKKFHADCGHVVNTQTCLDKLYEECKEFIDAYESGDHDSIVSERLDVMNTAIFSTYMDGMKDPLYFGALKLETTEAKYKRQRMTVQEYEDAEQMAALAQWRIDHPNGDYMGYLALIIVGIIAVSLYAYNRYMVGVALWQ